MDIFTDAYADQQDRDDPLTALREHFIIPTRGQLKQETLETSEAHKGTDAEQSTYLCGNSLGLQPKLVAKYTAAYHQTWATKGVYGHFKPVSNSPLAPWLHVDDEIRADMATLIGAEPSETVVMQTLTANIHFALASLYRPTATRYKIMIEGKAFPSDHFAISSQLAHHGHNPTDALLLINPPSPSTPTLTTEHILSSIAAHASSIAVLHLSAIQFYTGQLFDIPRITSFAHSHGITVGWDLAHAIGNVPLSLHAWDVDYAIWCSYKYLNSGPGSIGGLYIHNRHSDLPRLSGWWGSSKTSRFAMGNEWEPLPGAAGWQLSNPSVADLAALRASLDTFKLTSMRELRERSLRLTGYLERLLDALKEGETGRAFEVITPRNPEERGAQLSVRLATGLLETVMEVLEEEGVVVDERRPDVVRVAPAPLYNTFGDCLRFARVFEMACKKALEEGGKSAGGTMVEGGAGEKGWGLIV